MTVMTSFEVEVKLDFEAIKKLAGGNDIERALMVVGQVGEGAAKQFAPVDTGTLRRSITHEMGQRGLAKFVRIGTNISYAIFQEIGTRFHPAHPYLRPAIEAIASYIRQQDEI